MAFLMGGGNLPLIGRRAGSLVVAPPATAGAEAYALAQEITTPTDVRYGTRGVRFQAKVDLTVTHLRVWADAAYVGAHLALWSVAQGDGAKVKHEGQSVDLLTRQWVEVPLGVPLARAALSELAVVVSTSGDAVGDVLPRTGTPSSIGWDGTDPNVGLLSELSYFPAETVVTDTYPNQSSSGWSGIVDFGYSLGV